MARPTLFRNRKFLKVAHLLKINRAHLAGHLEFLWHAAYECGNPVVGDSIEVELQAEWGGESGVLAKALASGGFLDELDDGTYQIHDFWDHAPEYAGARFEREQERKVAKTCEVCGNDYRSRTPHSRFCSDACRQDSYRNRKVIGPEEGNRRKSNNVTQSVTQRYAPVTDVLRSVTEPAVTITACYRTPAPAPAPALKEEKRGVEEENQNAKEPGGRDRTQATGVPSEDEDDYSPTPPPRPIQHVGPAVSLADKDTTALGLAERFVEAYRGQGGRKLPHVNNIAPEMQAFLDAGHKWDIILRHIREPTRFKNQTIGEFRVTFGKWLDSSNRQTGGTKETFLARSIRERDQQKGNTS